MLQEITRDNLILIRNPIFRKNAELYLEIYENFISQIEPFGLPFHKTNTEQKEIASLLAELKQCPEITARCEDASIVYRNISTACEACKKGIGTITSHISFRCHRNCFFCFNPNQDNYEADLQNTHDWKRELEEIKDAGSELTHIALTGGEPLLHEEESVQFFATARELFPAAHLRLYTSGDLLTEALAEALAKAGLDEIRFSYKIEDTRTTKEKVLANMALAKQTIPSVMVEMPVMPDAEEEMQELLIKLDKIGIFCINLLELCFPYNNAEAFQARGYELKYPPYRTLYNFWYAGGLPIAGSELLALKLIQFAIEKQLKLGIHYCSLENKNFGQVYQQNLYFGTPDKTMHFSDTDYYLKTVKAYGEDAVTVKKLFDKRGVQNYLYRADSQFIQFHPGNAKLLRGRAVELAVSVNILEERDGETITRELKLLRATVEDCCALI